MITERSWTWAASTLTLICPSSDRSLFRFRGIDLSLSWYNVAEVSYSTIGRPSAISPELRERILHLYLQSSLSARELALALEQSDLRAPFGGRRWHPSTVTRILHDAGVSLSRGRPRTWRLLASRPRPSVLHVVTQIAYRRHTQGSGSDLWAMLEREGKLSGALPREVGL